MKIRTLLYAVAVLMVAGSIFTLASSAERMTAENNARLERMVAE